MIFKELVLQNFGPYQGRQVLNLTPGTDEAASPIILCGGMNGGGKTTLLDAIRLALYGQRAQCSTRRTQNYPEFLTQCVHYQADNAETASVELAFEYILNNIPKQIRIQRTWTRDPRGSRDALEILVDDWPDDALTKTWDEWIESVLPLGISNLFLFDGEQIKDLAEQETPPQNVVEAIRAILGLELADRLSLDLEVLIQRKRKALANDQELKALQALEVKLNEQNQARDLEQATVEGIESEIALGELAVQQAQESFMAQGGQIAQDSPQLQVKLQEIQTAIATQRQQLRELAAGELPLMLIQPLLSAAHQQAQKEVRRKQIEMARDLLIERDQRLLEILSELNLRPKQSQTIQAFLTNENQVLDQEAETQENWLEADLATLNQLTHLLTHQIPNHSHQVREQLKHLKDLAIEEESTERYLASAASVEVYQQLKADVEQAQTNLESIRLRRATCEERLRSIERAIALLKKELTQYSEQTLDQQNRAHFLTSAAKVQQTLDTFRTQLTLRKLSQLETRVTECFRYLLHKQDFIQRITINTQTFGLSLFNSQGKTVPKHRLSAGEKQILAIALLWGLARASGRQLPIAIDTPLSRLDSEHRHNLIERYFPQASHQVLLLSTDTEIRQEDVQRLRENDAIAHEYLLHYNPTDRQTIIQPGYFW